MDSKSFAHVVGVPEPVFIKVTIKAKSNKIVRKVFPSARLRYDVVDFQLVSGENCATVLALVSIAFHD